jgi:hypothetical protein
VNQPLRGDQIRATLARHGFSEDTPILGIRYEARGSLRPYVVISIEALGLVVPDDVLAMPAPPTDPARPRRLFPRES